jgi:hypothetical protein
MAAAATSGSRAEAVAHLLDHRDIEHGLAVGLDRRVHLAREVRNLLRIPLLELDVLERIASYARCASSASPVTRYSAAAVATRAWR